MADTEVDLEDLSRSRSLSLSSITHAARWRDKLREKAGKLKATTQPSSDQQENDISEFLGKPAGGIEGRPLNLGLQIPTNDALDPASFAPPPAYPQKPRRRANGLHVRFAEQEPDIIGEGGEECELPTQFVVGSWKGPPSLDNNYAAKHDSSDLPASLTSGSPQEVLSPHRYNAKESLQRTPTRKPVGGWEQRRSSMNIEEGLVQAAKDVEIPKAVSDISAPKLGEFNASETLEESSVGMLRKPLPAINGRPSIPQTVSPPLYGSAPPATRQSPGSPPVAYVAFSQGGSPPTVPAHVATAINDGQSQRVHIKESAGINAKAIDNTSRKALPFRSSPPSNHVQHYDGDHTSSRPVVGQAESDDFYSRVQHLRGVFRLAAEKAVNIENKALEHWLRMASWWFLRGKTTLQRSNNFAANDSGGGSGGHSGKRGHQCYVDLAKAWWTVEEILPDRIRPTSNGSSHSQKSMSSEDEHADLLRGHRELSAKLKEFAVFMHRQNLLPPPALLIQGADPCIWLPYPALPTGILSLTAWLDPRHLVRRTKRPFCPLLFDDTDHWFCYGQVFAEAEMVSVGKSEAGRLPCVITLFRARSHADMQMTIISQDGQIDLYVQSDPELGPTWNSIGWRPNEHAFNVPLSRDYGLEVRLWEDDSRFIAGLTNTSVQFASQWHASESEEILFDDKILVFHPTGFASNTSFPSGPVKNSTIRLYRRISRRTEGSSQRHFFDGYRLMARTPSTNKHLGWLNHHFARGAPILCSNLRGENEAPALLLAFRDGSTKSSLILTFTHPEQRSYFYAAISGSLASPLEVTSREIPLIDMSVTDLFAQNGSIPRKHPLSSVLKWNSIKIIGSPEGEGLEHIMFSDHLRICCKTNLGNIVDLSNLATGELQIGLDVAHLNTVKLYRPAQNNLITTFADNLFPKEELSGLQVTLQTIAQGPTARVYTFPSLDAQHVFQKLVTGFEVIYDGLATAFSISHRRNMIPLYKKQEATSARLQILVHENRGQKTFQLICVMSDFPDGKIMNFQVRSTDVFEATAKSGKHCVRLVDAKFALPKHPDNQDTAWDFVCLDAPEFPGEHDDIVIGFDSEQERDSFAKALPAPLKVSRLHALRRQ